MASLPHTEESLAGVGGVGRWSQLNFSVEGWS